MEKSNVIDTAPATAASANQNVTADALEIKDVHKNSTFKTAGEKLHKWGTYLGVDWIYNMITGVAFLYFIEYNKVGIKMWSPIKRGLETALTPLIPDKESRAKSVSFGNTFFGIIAGGMLTIPPLMILEAKNVRKKFAKFYDRIIYGNDRVDNDPKFQAAYERMDEEPKKDFWAGMGARFLALAPLLASVLIKETRKPMNKYYFTPIAEGANKVLNKLNIDPVSVIQKVSPHISREEAQDRWDNKINKEGLPMEVGFDIPYALLHKFWYHKLAEMRKDKTEGKKSIKVEEHSKASIRVKPHATTDERAAPESSIDQSEKQVDEKSLEKKTANYTQRENTRRSDEASVNEVLELPF
jgi:hypothetical protein